MINNNFKIAFSLPEVLLTIGIIGVVAALTLPVIHSSYEISVSKNKFKKDMAILNQVGQMSRLKYGYDFSTLQKPASVTTCKSETSQDFSICGMLNDSLNNAKYLGLDNEIYINSKIKWVPHLLATVYAQNFRHYVWQLPDGSLVAINTMLGLGYNNRNCVLGEGESIDPTWVSNHWWCIGYIDTNGVDLPNQEVSCSNKDDTKVGGTISCDVKKDLNHVTDIYPFVFHDDIVEPATNASVYLFRN